MSSAKNCRVNEKAALSQGDLCMVSTGWDQARFLLEMVVMDHAGHGSSLS